jgi:uncharacterized damage-inducible protein DinB
METFRVPLKVADGETHAAFSHDLRPLTKKELERYLKLLDHSRERLIKLLEAIESEFGGEMEKLFSWRSNEESNSLGEVLGHIVRAEAWYLARLAKKIDRWSHYAVLRQLTIDRLRRLTSEERKQETVHPPYDETWTARKVMRRALWHERYHIRQIEEILKKFRT